MSILDKITATNATGNKNSTVIGENCVIEGDVTFEKTIEVHGKIIGTLKIAENCTSASLIIKKTGIVEGDVYGSDVVIEGEVVGNVSGKKEIKIENSAFISGNVYYDILDVQGGATINGNLIRNKGKEPQKLENKSSAPVESIDKNESNEKLL
jgi:cytoskeletal protein CcmA (bactofilin family)